MKVAAAARATRQAALLSFSTTFALFALPLCFGRYYNWRDATFENVPALCAIDRWLDAGVTWLMPWIGGGSPIVGWHALQLFYPLKWLFAAFPPDVGASLSAAFHLALGAAGTTWLARSFGVRPATAAVAGAAFVLTGICTDLVEKSTYVMAAAWTPIAWAGARRALAVRDHGRLPYLVVALAPAGALLGGEPQTAGVCLGLVGLEAARALWRRRRGAALAMLRAALAAGGGACVGLLPWIPALAEMVLTTRGRGLGFEQALAWSYGPAEWLATLWPGIGGESVGLVQLWELLEDDLGKVPWNANPFVGTVLLGAIVAGVFERRVLTAQLAFFGGLVLSLGANTPVMPALMRLFPAFAMFRYPAKYLVITALAGIVLAAVFVGRARHHPARARRYGVALLAFLVAHGLGLALILVFAAPLDEAIAAAGLAQDKPVAASAVYSSVVLQALGLTVAALLLLALKRERAMGAMLPLAVLELCVAWAWSAPLTVPIADPLPLSRLVAGGRVTPTRVCVSAGFAHVDFLTHDDNTRIARHRRSGELQACDGLASAVPYPSPMLTSADQRLNAGLKQAYPNGARALGCKYVLHPKALLGDVARELSWEDIGESDAMDYFRVFRFDDDDIAPPAFLARGATLVDEDGAIATIIEAVSVGDMLTAVEDPLARLDGAALPSGERATLARVERPSADEAVLHLEGEGGAVVGIRSTFLVGWSARQGDVELPVVRVAAKHVGAVVDDVTRGPVELVYRAPRWRLAQLSFAAGIALVGAALLARRRR